MIEVTIGKEERDLRDVTVAWLRSIEKLRHSASPVCVKVKIVIGAIDMILATPDCPRGEAGRSYRGEERRIFELWQAKRMDSDQFTARDLEEFLNALKKL
jgi:hypothetical protein